MRSERTTAFGVEKPFPWVLISLYAGVCAIGLAGGCSVIWLGAYYGLGGVQTR